jgi:hypothetical protein
MAKHPHPINWHNDEHGHPIPVTPKNVLLTCPAPGGHGAIGAPSADTLISRLSDCGFEIVEKRK